jgi:hypothetical protein
LLLHDGALLAVLLIWLLPAFMIARLAERRGRSFTAFLVLALLLPWPAILLAVLILPRRHRSSIQPT